MKTLEVHRRADMKESALMLGHSVTGGSQPTQKIQIITTVMNLVKLAICNLKHYSKHIWSAKDYVSALCAKIMNEMCAAEPSLRTSPVSLCCRRIYILFL